MILDLYISTGHDILKGMIEGVLLPSLVVLDRAGRSIVPKSNAEAEVISKAMVLSMAK
jgi:hypothetical protein